MAALKEEDEIEFDNESGEEEDSDDESGEDEEEEGNKSTEAPEEYEMSLARANKVLEGSAFADIATIKVSSSSIRDLVGSLMINVFRFRSSLLPISPRLTNCDSLRPRKTPRMEEELQLVASSRLSRQLAKRTTEILPTPSSSKATSSDFRRRRRTVTRSDSPRLPKVEKDARSLEVTNTRSWTTRRTRRRTQRRRGRRTLR